MNSGGGAWFPPAIDTKSGLMFWGIGNPAPWPGTAEFPNGSSRPGVNLYTDSLIALKHDSGALAWYQQAKAHDLFDMDLQNSPVLATLDLGAGPTEIVIASGKLGQVIAYERSTGKLLWTVPVGKHQNDDLAVLPAGITQVFPGPLGGVETPIAYQNGVVYAPVVDMSASYTPKALDATSMNYSTAKGQLAAIDARTGKIIWTQNFDSMNVGGATVVNDLVFTSTLDGKIFAFNCKTGTKAWEYQAPGGINGWPAVAGNTIVFPVGMGSKPVLLALSV
jgi:glucose dehydrogenase